MNSMNMIKLMKQKKQKNCVQLKETKKLKFVLLGLITLNFSGCAIFEPPQVKYLPNDSSMIALNHIAQKAEKSSNVLAEIQQSQSYRRNAVVYSHRAYRHKNSSISGVCAENKFNFVFQGKVDEAARKLSSITNYQYLLEGTLLPNWPAINVNENQSTLPVILSHINAQLPKTIKLVGYPKTKTILMITQKSGV